MSRISKTDLWAALLIGLAVAVVFGQTLGHQSIAYDDPYFISRVPQVMSGLSWENTLWAWRTDQMSIWHPLTWLSYQLESDLFGAENDRARFLTNTLLHLLNSWLVYLLGKDFNFSRVQALIIALLFALHPQHVEVVAWLSERKELLASSFVLLSMRQYLAYRETPSFKAYALCLGFFVLAMMSKASAAPMALLLPLISGLDLYFNRNTQTRSLKALVPALVTWLPFLLVATGISMLTINMQAAPVNDQLASLDAGLDYLLMIGVRFAWYLQTSFWPGPQLLFHPIPDQISGLVMARSALLISVFLLLVWRYRSNKLFLIGIAWFILFLAPTSGIVPVDAIFVSNRYSYQAHIGLLIALLTIIKTVKLESRAKTLYSLLGVVIVIFGIISFQQTAKWRNDLSLFTHEMQTRPSEAAAVQLGYAYFMAQDYTQARRYYAQAIALNPDGFYGYAYLGFVEEKLGNIEAAEQRYAQGLANVSPNKYHHIEAVYERLSWASSTLKNHSLAIQTIRQGLKLFPDNRYLKAQKIYYEQYYPDMIKRYWKTRDSNKADLAPPQ